MPVHPARPPFTCFSQQSPRDQAEPAAREGAAPEAGGEGDPEPRAALPAPAQTGCCPRPGQHPSALLAQVRSLQLWRHKRQSLGQEEPHRGCWVVAQAESTGQTCAELWLERDLRLQDLRLHVESRHKEQWAGQGERRGSRGPVSCP